MRAIRARGLGRKRREKRGKVNQMTDKGETADIPGLPSGNM